MKGTCNIEAYEKLLVLSLDILFVLCAYMMANQLAWLIENRSLAGVLWSQNRINFIPPFIIFPITIYIFELYQSDRWRHNSRLLIYITTAVICGAVLMTVCSFILPKWFILDRKALLLHVFFCIIFLFIIRKLALNRPLAIDLEKNILMIGNHRLLDEIFSLLKNKHAKHYSSLTWIKPNYDRTDNRLIYDCKTGEHLTSLIENKNFSTMILSDDLLNIPDIKSLLPRIRLSGARIYDPFNYYELLANRVAINHIEPSWFLFHNQGVSFNPRIYLKIKKVFEAVLSLCLLILLIPIYGIISLLIVIFDGKPVLFRQERMGKDGKTFTLYKFRTMTVSSRSVFIPAWKQTDITKNAVTPIGKWLRKSHLDELPQLFNILKGDMSFIGPRPIRPGAAEILRTQIPFYAWRFAVKPGLTGWAQVCTEYGDTLEGQAEKLQYDLYYVQNQSVILDFLTLLKTIRSFFYLEGK